MMWIGAILSVLAGGILFGLWIIFGGYYLFVLLFLYIFLFIITTLVFLLFYREPSLLIDVCHSIYQKKDNVIMHIRLTSEKNIVSSKIICYLRIVNVFGETVETQKVYLKQHEQTFHVYMSHCGYYRIILEKVYCFDVFHSTFKRYTKNLSYHYYVFPKVTHQHIPIEQVSTVSNESYEYSSSKKGDDLLEIFDIHLYQPGDLVKNIHWKLSSKHSKLLVKDGSLPIRSKIQMGIKIDSNAQSIDRILENFYEISTYFLKNHILFEIWKEHDQCFIEVIDENHFRELFKDILVSLSLYIHPSQQQGYIVSDEGVEVIS